MDPYGNVYHINCGIMVLTVVKRYDYNTSSTAQGGGGSFRIGNL